MSAFFSFFLIDHSVNLGRLKSEKKKKTTCLRNQAVADGSCSIFISICATLGNFNKNMLIWSFPSVFSQTVKVSLSDSSLYSPTLRLSWMFTFSLPRFLEDVEKDRVRRNNVRKPSQPTREDVWIYQHGSQEKKKILSSST